jgi:predicted nucleic acid-binding protein
MSGAKAFFDTNVLLYMYGGDESKQQRAKELFRQYARSGRLLLSTQVVQEFYSAGSRKLGMPRRELRDATAALLDCPLIIVAPPQIMAAIQNEERFKISFWDALILAAAESGGAEVVYTEDLNDGQQYGTVLVRNPFRWRET